MTSQTELLALIIIYKALVLPKYKLATFPQFYRDKLLTTFATTTRAEQRQQAEADEASSELVQKNGMESEKMRSTI